MMPNATRLTDWQTRLHECITAAQALPFEWGVHDCCLFAADCVHVITGVDHAASFRGKYSTALGAQRVITERGGLVAFLTEQLGEPVHPALAQTGDVGLFKEGEQDALAVFAGSAWFATGPQGTTMVAAPMLAVWRCA